MKTRLAFLYVLAIIFLILIVVLAIGKEKEMIVEEEEVEEIEYQSKENIQLLRSENGQIEEVNLNYYLLCVVASEISFKYEYEAIKAQVVVARTYLFNKIINSLEEQGDVCDSYKHCQAFNDIEVLEKNWYEKGYTYTEIEEGKNKIKKAIVETQNQIITYNGEIINALFHASSPNKTENAKAIWSNEDVPYLKSVENVEDESYENRKSFVEISYPTFKSVLIDNGYILDLTQEDFSKICVNEYTESGRVKNINVGAYRIKAENLRTLFNIKSTDFSIQVKEDKIIFDVTGYGHGVGMSQVGANTYAKAGYTYDQIIHHYYTNVDIVDGYNVQMKRGEI